MILTKQEKEKLFEHTDYVQKTMENYCKWFGKDDECFKRKRSEWVGCYDILELMNLTDEYASYQVNKMKR